MENVDKVKRGAPGSGSVQEPDIIVKVYMADVQEIGSRQPDVGSRHFQEFDSPLTTADI